MSTMFLRHIHRRLLDRVAALAAPDTSGALILLRGPAGSRLSTALDSLSASLADRPQSRIALLPWYLHQPGSLRTLLPAQLDDTVLLIDDLHHADEQSLTWLVSQVRRPGSTTVVLATVDGPGLDALATDVIQVQPLTLAETAGYLGTSTGTRVSTGTVEVIHTMTGGLPGFIDDIIASAGAGQFSRPGAAVPVPQPWRARWEDKTAGLSEGDIAQLTAGDLKVPEAAAAGLVHTVLSSTGSRIEFVDPRDAAVAASLNLDGQRPEGPMPGSVEFERRQLDRALGYASRLELPAAEIYLDECQRRVEPQVQDSLRGYIALNRGLRRRAHHYLAGAGTDPHLAVNGVLLSLADWDLRGMQRRITAVVAQGAPESHQVQEASILGLVSDAALSGRMPVVDVEPTSALNRQRLEMVHGWLSLTFDDPLNAREKLQYVGGQSPAVALWKDAWLARTLYVLGEWTHAARVVERGLATAEIHDADLLVPLLLWTGVQIAAMQGDQLLSKNYLSRLTLGEDAFLLQSLPAAMGRMVVHATNADLPTALRAGELLAKTVASTDTQHPGFWPWEDVYAQTLIRAGKIDLADEVVTSAEERHNPSGLISLIAKNAVPRATIQIQRGDLAAGVKTFESAVEAISATPMPAYQARILFEYGKVLRRHGRRLRADEVFAAAAEIFAQMNASVMVGRCAAERRIGGVSTATAGERHHNPHGLTPQEEQIALRVVDGATNSGVARELTLSTKTVEYHLTRVYRKLGVTSRQGLRRVLGQG